MDFFANIFDPPISVPSKPERPSKPSQDTGGAKLKLEGGDPADKNKKDWPAEFTKDFEGVAYLKNPFGTNGNTANAKFASRVGFLVSSYDSKVT